jgi:small nuclear ribonucleoprotein (snRNP)-like protein
MPEPYSSPLFDDLLGREVVLDMVSQYVILGTLTGYDDRYLVLEKADVHDLRDTSTTREIYVLDSHRFGIRSNRSRVLIKIDEIVSLSVLAEVLE